MSDTEPLRLPVEHQLDELTRAIAALTDGVAKLGAAEEKTQAETKKAADSMDRLKDGLSNVKGGFSDAWEAAETWAGRINAVVDRVTELASEQQRLDLVTERTGLDLDQAAAAAGRFADETEAAGAASAFLQAGTQLTQRELDAVMRVAGSASQMLGITTREATQQLTQALISGSQEGLRRYSPELAALSGNAHTTAERLDALSRVARNTAQATDSAADSVARFRDSIDDATRTIATSFVQELGRLQGLGEPFRRASGDAEEFNRTLRAIGQTAAQLVTGVAHSVDAAMGAIQYVGGQAMRPLSAVLRATGLARGDESAQLIRAGEERMRSASDSLERQFSDLYDDRTTARPDDAPAVTNPRRADMVISLAEANGAPSRRRSRQRRDPYEALRARIEAENDILAEDRREQEQRAAEEERIAKARSQQEQRDADARRDAMERAQERDRQRGERDFAESDAGLRAANDNARLDRQRTRDLERRRNELRSFTDFFEEQHQRQTSAAQQSAEAVTQALGAVGTAYSKHLMALVQGREEGGAALRGFLADTLTAIGQESATKAGFNLAEGIAAAATYRYDAAAQHFAAAGIYTVVAAGAGAAGAALAPSAAAPAASGASSVGSPRGDRTGVGAANDNGRGTTIIEQHYYSPVIGGRDATSAEVGRGMQQFTRAADRRRLGRTGTGP